MEYNMNTRESIHHCHFWPGPSNEATCKAKKESFMQQAVKVIAKQVQEEAEQGSRKEIH